MSNPPNVQANIEAHKRRVRRKARKVIDANLSLPKFSPAMVGFVRGVILAAMVGLVGGLTTIIQSGHMGKASLVWIGTTVATAVLRFFEGVLDGKAGAPNSARLLGGPPKT